MFDFPFVFKHSIITEQDLEALEYILNYYIKFGNNPAYTAEAKYILDELKFQEKDRRRFADEYRKHTY